MFLLTPEDVEVISIQHPKRAQKVPILSYQDKTYRLLKVFQYHQYDDAHTAWRDLTNTKGKACVLLEEPYRYSIWQQVRIDRGLLQPMVPSACAKACVLIVQTLYGDVERILGNKQAKRFGVALEADMTRQMQLAGGLGAVLRLNPLVEGLPQWEESDLNALLLGLHRLGTKFFGKTQFSQRTLGGLNDLPDNEKAMFLNWLKLSLISHLWLS
ncbi:MAG: Npun_F0813 family protein [Phormidesmis sp.]